MMIDFNALHATMHNTYDRWGKGADDIQIKYLDQRNLAREKALASYHAQLQKARVKPAGSPSTPAPSGPSRSLPPAPHLVLSPEEHKAALLAKYGKNRQGMVTGPERPSPLWTGSQKGYNQPDLRRQGPARFGAPAPAPRPTLRQVWESGIADIQARRIEQHTRMAQQSRKPSPAPAPKPSGGGWLASTGRALLAKADQIGTERAVRSRTFSAGAQSHSTGHGQRMF